MPTYLDLRRYFPHIGIYAAIQITPMHEQLIFVGYTRTSTRRQADEGLGHDHQAAAIRDFVFNSGGKLLEIRSDTGSGFGAESLERRPDLQEALRLARKAGAILVLNDLSRLARDRRVLDAIGPSLPRIWCLKLGREVSGQDLIDGIEHAQGQGERIREQTVNAVRRSRRAGTTLGSPDLAPAQRAGCIANGSRAETKVRQLATILTENPDWLGLPRRALVENLNAAGHWNCLSERHRKRVPWTIGALRKPQARALDLLRLDDEINAEEIDLSFPGSSITSSQSKTSSPDRDFGIHEPQSELSAPADDDLDGDCEAEILRDLYEAGVVSWEYLPGPWRFRFGLSVEAGDAVAAPPSSLSTPPASTAPEALTRHQDEDGFICSNGWFFDDTEPVDGPHDASVTAVELPDPVQAFSQWDHAHQDTHDLTPDTPLAGASRVKPNTGALMWQEAPLREIEHVPKHGARA